MNKDVELIQDAYAMAYVGLIKEDPFDAAFQKARELDAHVQHFNRFNKGLLIKNLVKFTVAAERAIVPSARQDEKPHHVSFKEGSHDCDCESFMYGNVHDKDFACYHIIAAKIRWSEILNVKTS